MNENITLLTKQAAKAVPSWPRRRRGPVGRWSRLWPVYVELRRKGFTIREAVDWLIRERVVREKDRKKAEYGLPMVDSRRRREEALARGEQPARRARKKQANEPKPEDAQPSTRKPQGRQRTTAPPVSEHA